MKFPIVPGIIVSLASAASAMTPSGLRCENRIDPLGVEVTTPRLSWQLQAADGKAGKSQTAWQILVASSEANLSADIGDLWDSGKVTSQESRAIQTVSPGATSGKEMVSVSLSPSWLIRDRLFFRIETR